MKEYLLSVDIPEEVIEIDPEANITSDTCRYEKEKYSSKRNVIFVTQGYHLPRTLYLCDKVGIQGVGIPAQVYGSINSLHYSFFTKITVKTQRYVREAALTWALLLNIYE